MRSSCKCSLKPIHWCKHGNRSQEYSTVMVVQRENDQLTRNDRKFGDVMSKNRNRADSSLGYFWGFTIIQHGIRYSGVMWGLLQPPIFGIETCRLPICWRRWTILFCGCNHFQAWSKWNMFQGPCKTSLTQCWTTRPSLKFVTWTNWTCSRHSAPQVTFVQSPNALWAVDVSQRTSETKWNKPLSDPNCVDGSMEMHFALETHLLVGEAKDKNCRTKIEMDMSWFENAVLTGANFSYQILAIRWFIPPFFGYPNECGHFTRNMLRL